MRTIDSITLTMTNISANLEETYYKKWHNFYDMEIFEFMGSEGIIVFPRATEHTQG